MNTLTTAIAEVCAQRRFEEKWLLAPSRRVAYQWIDAVAQGGQPTLNLRAQTLPRLVLHLAGPQMAARGLKLLAGRAGELLVDRIWNRDVRPDGEYLARMEPEAEFCRRLYAAVRELRLAGLDAGSLDAAEFEDERKGREVRALLQAWTGALQAEGRVDYAGALAMARQALQQDGLPKNMLVLLPAHDEDEFSALELDFLSDLPEGALVELPVDQPMAPQAPPTGLSRLAWLPEPAEAPEASAEALKASGDGSVEYFHAVGCANEVRHALRRCLSEGRPLDQVELLHTDRETYVALVYEVCCDIWGGDGADLPESLPVTFAEGLPVRYSRPGRALAAWMQWWTEGCPQAVLVRMLQEGLLVLPPEAEDLDWQELADMLRPLPIGEGRERYAPALENALERLRFRAQVQLGTDAEGEPLADAYERQTMERARRKLPGMEALKQTVEALLRTTPRQDQGPARILECALEFLTAHVRRGSKLDDYARRSLLEETREMSDLLGEGESVSLDVTRWLADLPRETRVLGSGPRPGCLHVANLDRGGHSGRPLTVLVGLDDGRFPGGSTQDPVMLDHERERISDRLPRKHARVDARVRALARTLAGLRGRLVVGCSCRDLSDDREVFPSSAMLAAYRITSGRRGADQADLLEALGPPASFAPSDAGRCLGEDEWWLWRLCTAGPAENALDAALARFDHLARGRDAQAARLGPELTSFDGYVPEAGAAHDPTAPGGQAVSASRLETLGRCPLQYFFGQVLGIGPPDELELEPDQWLDALQSGTLLHRTFHDFMVERVEADEIPPSYDRDLERLMEVLEEGIEYWRAKVPPPGEAVFQRERRDLRAACRYFLADEESFCRESTPRFLEAAIGVPPSEPPTEMDRQEPMPFELPGGGAIRVRARLDRVDRRPDGDWTVWDYKTGSATPYRSLDRKPYNGGRRVQHVLYLHLAERALRRLEPEARVVSFGYFLPGVRGRGERVQLSREQLQGGACLVEHLARTMAAGAFPPTDAYRHTCEFCDFKDVCGNVEELTAAAAEMLADEEIDELTDFREARRYD